MTFRLYLTPDRGNQDQFQSDLRKKKRNTILKI